MKRPLCLVAVLFLGIWLFLAGGFHLAEDQKPSLLEQYAQNGDKIVLQGVVSKREERPTYQMYYLTDVHIRLKEQFIKESKLLVYVKQTSKPITENEKTEYITIGSKIWVNGETAFFDEARNPGNFDQKEYYRKQGIHGYVWAESYQVVEKGFGGVREYLTRFRMQWKTLFVKCLGEKYGNCMSAILLGDKSELDKETKNLYQKGGIGHILAISGLHMSFIGIGLYKILRRCGMSFLYAGIFGAFFLILYTWMIGGGVSGQRALVMFVIRVGADMSGRDYDLLTSLSLAAIVIIARQPLYLFDAGFLLSFGALLGIAVVEPVLKNCTMIPSFLRGGMAIQIVLFPLLLYYYYEIPIYAVFLNLAVIPLMSFVLGAGILGSFVAVLHFPSGKWILSICKWILSGYEFGAKSSLFLPCGRIVTGQPEKWMMVVYYLFVFGGCAAAQFFKERERSEKESKRKRGACIWKRIIRSSLLLCMPFFGVMTMLGHQKRGEMQVTMLDVGQGDGLYLKSPSGKKMMIDGGSTDIRAVGEYRLESFLKNQGVGKLDYIFVSHGDEDHINGIRELLLDQTFGIAIDTLVLPDERVLDSALLELAQTAEKTGTKVTVFHAGEQWSDGNMTLKCLAPLKEYQGEAGNAASMVLELDYGNFEMLFTGDAEGLGEDALVSGGKLKNYDILKVAHHGSKNSTSNEFLEQTKPKEAWISSGINNRYGHPHNETIERLKNQNCIIRKTQDSGAVTVYTNGKQMRTEMFCKMEDFQI